MFTTHDWRIRSLISSIAVSLTWLLTSTALAVEAAGKPNIVLILADDLGRADVGFMGAREIKTPHLDQLAAGGAVLDSFYVQPVCSPTRAALLTGRYPTHTGVYSVVRPGAAWGLPLAERTLPAALHDAGYHTAICGKWHLGEYRPEYRPTERGFDEQYGHFFGALDYFTKLRDGKRDWYRNDEPCSDDGYSTHLVAGEACRIIRERPRDKPLFLYIPFNAVHGPYQVPDKYLEPYAQLTGTRLKYAGMIAALDEAIGQVVQALQAARIFDHTLIVFSSDNGGPGPGRITDNGPLRAGKGTIYEGGVRVCAMAHWPGKISAGLRVDQPIHAVDCYSTFLRLGGASLDQPLPVDGRDVWPVITQHADSPHDAILLCGQPNKAAVRAGNWKLLLNATAAADAEADSGVDQQNKKQSQPKKKKTKKSPEEGENLELYNLAEDLGERNNLAQQHPERVRELRARLAQFLNGAVAPGNPD